MSKTATKPQNHQNCRKPPKSSKNVLVFCHYLKNYNGYRKNSFSFQFCILIYVIMHQKNIKIRQKSFLPILAIFWKNEKAIAFVFFQKMGKILLLLQCPVSYDACVRLCMYVCMYGVWLYRVSQSLVGRGV